MAPALVDFVLSIIDKHSGAEEADEADEVGEVGEGILVEYALDVLCCLMYTNSNQPACINAGGIETAMKLLTSSHSSIGQLELATKALHVMMGEDHTRHARWLAAGGLAAAVNLANNNNASTTLLRYVFKLLGNASNNHADNATACGSAGAIEAVLDVMNRHVDEGDLLEHACKVLGSIVKNDCNKGIFKAAGGNNVLMNVILHHGNSSTSQKVCEILPSLQ